ncbi:MAG: S26 family signal peptidase [Nanoarchaeota archaeon]|nr:S26 family signal peptidase [Nanoarchaeota archaeon]
MDVKKGLKRFWRFLKKDSWQSWIVSILLIIILIKWIFFPTLNFITGSNRPLVIVESCSMYHGLTKEYSTTAQGLQWTGKYKLCGAVFDKDERISKAEYWEACGEFYESKGINQSEFESFSLSSGLNKGDIVFVWGRSASKLGDIIIFETPAKHPLIHRLIALRPKATKGDHNEGQLAVNNNANGIDETNIAEKQIIGKAVGKIPYAGWIKLIWFEPFRRSDERGLC